MTRGGDKTPTFRRNRSIT